MCNCRIKRNAKRILKFCNKIIEVNARYFKVKYNCNKKICTSFKKLKNKKYMNGLIKLFTLLLISTPIVAQTNATLLAFSKSIEFEKKAEYLPAIQSINSLNDSTSYDVVIRLGWLHYKAGLTLKAMQYYKTAIDIKPNAIEPRYGYTYPAYLLEDHSKLISEDENILKIDPNNKTINANLGLLYFYKKEYNKALPYFEKLVNLYPFDYECILNLAWAFAYLSKNADAEKHFNTVLFYSPKDKSALEGLLYVKANAVSKTNSTIDAFYKSYELSEKSDFKGAIQVLKNSYDKESYPINLRLGWLNYSAGMQLEAVNYYKIAVDLMPNSVEAKLGAVYPAAAMGNKTEVKKYYEAVLKLDSQNTYTHYNLGMMDYTKKDYQAALVHFQKIVTLYPSNTDGLLMLGWTNLQLLNPTEATQLFNKVLCFYPNNASALLGLKSKPESEIKKKTGF